MTATDRSAVGRALFGRYAYPPNELGYCGPTDIGGASELASHASEFDGAWPYLTAIADAIGATDALDEDVVTSYWIGGPALDRVEPAQLLSRLRSAFRGQVTGLLEAVSAGPEVMAHHSFQVFVVYPWIKFLHRDATVALSVMQDCRIRWGTVDSVADEHVVIVSRPLRFADGVLTLGEPAPEPVQWKKDELSLAPAPVPGEVVAAHWNWICGTLTADQCDALAAATQATLNLVNLRAESVSAVAGSEHTGG